jgi:uncharacterized Zn-finger protein
MYKRKSPCDKSNDVTKMKTYICDSCNKPFSTKSNLTKHIKRTYCNQSSISSDLSEKIHDNTVKGDQIDHICYYCEKKFSRADNLMRHINKSCYVKKQLDGEKEMIFQKLLEKITLQDERITTLEEENKVLKQASVMNNTTNNTTNTTNNTTTTNNNSHNNYVQNNYNNIKLVAFGEEDLSYITDFILVMRIQNIIMYTFQI